MRILLKKLVTARRRLVKTIMCRIFPAASQVESLKTFTLTDRSEKRIALFPSRFSLEMAWACLRGFR